MAHPRPYFSDVVKVGAGKVRTLDLPQRERTTRVEASWESDSPVLRAVIIEKGQLALWLRGQPHQPVALGDYGASGKAQGWLINRGSYVVALDNQRQPSGSADVRLTVTLSSANGSSGVRHPDPWKAELLVWVSVSLFAVAAVYFATQIMLGLRGRSKQTDLRF